MCLSVHSYIHVHILVVSTHLYLPLNLGDDIYDSGGDVGREVIGLLRKGQEDLSYSKDGSMPPVWLRYRHRRR